MDYRSYHLSAAEWVRLSGTGFLFCAAVSYKFFRSIAALLLLLPAGLFVYPLYQRNALLKKQKRTLAVQFKDAIGALSSFLGAGYSVENAFSAATDELESLYGRDALIVKEFSVIRSGIRMNKPAEALLLEFAERSGLDDIRNFAEVFLVAKRSGGELCAIIQHTSDTIRDRVQLTEEIENLTASQRYQQKIMNLLPFLMILYIDQSSDGFLDIMYQSFAGRAVMTVCLCIYAAAYLLSEKILDIRL